MNQVRNINFYLIVLIAFCLPVFPRITPLLALFVLITSLTLKNNYIFIFKNKVPLLVLLFFIVYCIGMLYTSNEQQGLFNLQVKLSFLFFPFILLPIREFNASQIKKVFSFFIYGCLIACIACFVIATYNYIEEKWLRSQQLYNLNYGINFFLSSRLSCFMHPSYFAMYLGFAVILLMDTNNYKPEFSNKTANILLIIFSITTFFLASKAGIIVYFLLITFYFIKNKKTKQGLIFIGSIFLLFVFLFFAAPEFANKFKNAAKALTEKKVDSGTVESSSERVLIWQSAMDVISDHPLLGTGTGDSKDEMQKKYEENGYSGLLEKKLNLHNQFFETFAAVGMPGLITLILLFYFGISSFLKNKNILGTLLLVMVFINFLFESMLETQAGVLFFAFWIIMLNYVKREEATTAN